MRKLIRTALAILIAILLSVSYVQAQVEVGLRDNQYVHIGYTWKGKWNATLEHSVFSQEFSTQYVRLLLGYIQQWRSLEVKVMPYYGTLYNGDFYNAGLTLRLHWSILKGWGLTGIINPHYDSGFDYTTCFLAGTDIHLYEGVFLLAQYSTIPEYRMEEEHCKVGLCFVYGDLSVTPMLSIPVDNSGKHVRLLCGFEYVF